jgi:hypothetical protein
MLRAIFSALWPILKPIAAVLAVAVFFGFVLGLLIAG